MKTARQFKYYSTFTATASCTVDAEKGGNLSLASVKDLQSILPKGFETNPDLLPIAANTCVANIGNAWGDLLDTDGAKLVYNKFVHKFINLEHDRSQIVGHITNASLSEYHANYSVGAGSKILTEEQVTGFEPFNIAIAGYVYRVAYPEVADKLVEANDPDSKSYLGVSLSWELGFDNYILMVGSKDRNDSSVELITDPAKIEAYSSYLKSKGGKNKMPDGRPLYRIITASTNEDGTIDQNSIVPVGVGLTFTPAAAVAGVITPHFESKANIIEQNNKNENINSHLDKGNVTTNISHSMKSLTSLADVAKLNDETAKEYSFANIANLVQASEQSLNAKVSEAVKQANEAWETKIKAEQDAKASLEEKAKVSEIKVSELESKLTLASDKITSLEKAQEDTKASQKFNERMAFFDENYTLEDADRKALASRVKSLDDSQFKEFAENEFAVFAAAKKKNPFDKTLEPTDEEKKKLADDAKSKKAKDAAKATAPEIEPSELETAFANLSKLSGQAVPNSVEDAGKNLMEKLTAAFKIGEGVKISK